MRDDFAKQADPAKQKAIAVEIQKRDYEIVTYVPLGQFYNPVAYRDYPDGVLETPVPLCWNMSKK